jgi:hypothetical protein
MKENDRAMGDADRQRKRAYVVVWPEGEHDDDEEEDSLVSSPGEELTSATVLQRNPPACGEAESHTTHATLAVGVDGEPCDCIYISPAAVETHKVRNPLVELDALSQSKPNSRD